MGGKYYVEICIVNRRWHRLIWCRCNSRTARRQRADGLRRYEANITDEARYTTALPEVEKIIKGNGGPTSPVASTRPRWFTAPEAGNRYVIVRLDRSGGFDKFGTTASEPGLTKMSWRTQFMVEGVEAK